MPVLILKKNADNELEVDVRNLCDSLDQVKKDYPNADLIIEGDAYQGDIYDKKTKTFTPKPVEQRPAADLRREAYQKIDIELLEALAEKEEGNPEKMQTYLIKRQQIRDSIPLEGR